MTARSSLPETSPVLRLFQPAESPENPPDPLHILPANGAEEHRIRNPVRRPPDPAAGAEPSLRDLFAEVAADHADAIQPIPPDDRERVRTTCTLAEFHAEFMAPIREQQLAAGTLAPGTWQKEQQALRRYTDWDADPARRPARWPANVPWRGLPIGYVSGKWLDQLFAALAAGRESGGAGLAQGTCRSTWYQLRTIWNFAVKVLAIESAPQPGPLDQHFSDDEEGLFATVFSLAELGAIYRQLSGQTELQAALVLAACAGPRPVDLFGLRWGRHVRLDQEQPEIWYRAQKTGKRHWVPLAPCTVAHLQRLKSRLLVDAETLVFPSLTSGRARDPEKSRAARARNAALKAAIEAAGLECPEKPWQVLRATCSTRLNDHAAGVGRLLLHGPDTGDVNSRSYDGATERIRQAVLSIPQPAEFLPGCAGS